jgi:hypothetical protein
MTMLTVAPPAGAVLEEAPPSVWVVTAERSHASEE